MNILVLIPRFLPAIGGAEIGVHEIYSRLGRRHQVTVLSEALRRHGAVEGFDQHSYAVLHYRDYLNLGNIGGRMLLRGCIPPFSVGATCGAYREIRRLRPDVVNVHYAAYTGLGAVWSQRVLGVPTVLSLVGRDAAPGPDVPHLWPWYARLVARQVAHTIFISEFCQSYYGTDGLRSSVIPYGADTTRISPCTACGSLRERLGIDPGVHVLFSLQRLAPIKHVEVALYSVRTLVDQGIAGFVLLIGGDGPESSRLRELADSLGIQEHVRFLGYVPETQVPNYFALADLFVFPSLYETFGIVLAQAMSAGLPVVATRTTAIPEVVRDGVTGLLSPPLDAEAMAKNIARLLDDEALRAEMGRRAREIAEQLYDWDRVAARYERVLFDVATDR